MEKIVKNMIVLFVLYLVPFVFGGYHQDKVLLTDVKTLTLKHGAMTNARRSSPVPQLKCVGGSAGCHTFVPQVAQCYNRGSDGYDVQWECKTDMDNNYKFGQVEVTCEGFDYPDDPYVLKGSCGLEFMLDVNKDGNNQGRQSNQQYSGYQQSSDQHSYKKKSGFGDLVMLAGVGLVVYAIYKTCLSSNNTGGRQGDPGGYPRDDSQTGSQGPPPPGFRSEYMPGNDGCSSGTSGSSQTHTNGMGGGLGGGLGGLGGGLGGNRGTGGGFWTGAMTGGLLGYMFGGRNQGYGNQGYANQGYGSGYGTRWGGSSNGGSSWFGSGSSGFGSGGSGFGSGGSGFGSSSSGSRSTSGFGGTKRR